MAGNEKKIAKMLVRGIGKIVLPHLGIIQAVGAPEVGKGNIIEMHTAADVDRLLATEDSKKKADIYINGHGISVKQSGSSNLFNRVQRAELLEIFALLGFSNPNRMLHHFDQEIHQFHEGKIKRDRLWQNFFTEDQFKALLSFLMMQGSPNYGRSNHPAEFILEAPSKNIQQNNIIVVTFEEYLAKHKHDIKIGLRRVWYGQESKSEHGRACSLMNKKGNLPWVFDNVSGQPMKHSKTKRRWRSNISSKDRKTVYFFMVLK